MTATLADLRPGDLGFGPIGGAAGLGVRIGEALATAISAPKEFATWRKWRGIAHCGTVIGEGTPGWTPGNSFGRGPIFAQAEPSGYEAIELGAEHWTSDWIYIRPAYQRLSTGPAARPGVSQADTVAWLAQWMVDRKIPYGFEDYAAITGHRLGLHSKGLDDFIARVDPDTMLPQRAICSQGVDAQLTLSGGLVDGKVFDDGRLPQDVLPIELCARLIQVGAAMVFRPGVT